MPIASEAPESAPVMPEIAQAPELPAAPALPEELIPMPIASEAPESAPIVPEMPEPPAAPALPEELAPISIAPEAPRSAPVATEMPHQKKQATKNKQPLDEKKERSALSIFFNVIFYFVLVFSILFIILFGNQNPQAIPRNVMGYSVMRVATSSMEPNIPVNSLIVTRATNPRDLQVDDIVTYGRANNTTLTHRIHEIVEDHTPGMRGFVLKGDALVAPDPEIAAGQNIIGRVIFISYSFGRALMFFQNQFWLVITLVVLILIVLFVLQDLFKTKKTVRLPQKKQPDTKSKAKKVISRA
jgi:signal peptidase I